VKVTDLLSSLPNDWLTIPLKTACYYAVSNVDKHSFEDEIPVRICNYTDVYNNDRVSPKLDLMVATATEDEIEKFHLETGDVIITKDSESWDDIGIPAYVEGTADDFVCGYHLAFMRPDHHLIDGRFLFRCIQSRPVSLQLELEATGVTRFGLPKSAIGNAIIPLPSLETQCLIADYLDRETKRINALVSEKEKMLALLEEKCAALISRAVTRGLNPDAPLQSSGLDWLGDLPAHWDIRRLKFVLSDLIYRLRVRDDLISPDFLTYFLITKHARSQIKRDARGSSGSMVKVSQRHVLEWQTPVPPLSEQFEIVKHIKISEQEFEILVNELSTSISLLKERRNALITATVTGQINIEVMTA
jgi:restriction endonuclease S subunit